MNLLGSSAICCRNMASLPSEGGTLSTPGRQLAAGRPPSGAAGCGAAWGAGHGWPRSQGREQCRGLWGPWGLRGPRRDMLDALLAARLAGGLGGMNMSFSRRCLFLQSWALVTLRMRAICRASSGDAALDPALDPRLDPGP